MLSIIFYTPQFSSVQVFKINFKLYSLSVQ